MCLVLRKALVLNLAALKQILYHMKCQSGVRQSQPCFFYCPLLGGLKPSALAGSFSSYNLVVTSIPIDISNQNQGYTYMVAVFWIKKSAITLMTSHPHSVAKLNVSDGDMLRRL